jgi:hypothetical protein
LLCRALLRLAHQDVRHTASSTPTGIQLRAVRIPKNQLAGCIGTVKHDGELVESDSAMAIAQATRQVAGHGSRRAPHVDDDDVVTAGMHFPKSKWHCYSVELQASARLILPARHSESQGGIFSGISRPQNARRVNPIPGPVSSWLAVGIVVYAAYDRRLVDYLRALTVVSYGTFLDAGLHVSPDSIATC